MAMQNLGSPMQLGFPISNYTMSLALLERIDFWDTTEDAIGEDFHMFVKAYFKTHGQVGAPISVLLSHAAPLEACIYLGSFRYGTQFSSLVLLMLDLVVGVTPV